MIEVKALQGQVGTLVDDLREQASAGTELDTRLRKVHAEATAAERVGVPYETWLEGELDKAAVAWVLSCVFVRYCEDNRLVDRVWIGGPEAHATAERAMQARQAYVRDNPRHYEREWLKQAFAHLRDKRATSRIFDEHNPVWEFAISGQAAEDLADFFRRGAGFRSLRTPDLNTRFLGDLYEHLSVYAQKTWALRQTPEFVEEFILDRTLNPALEEFGLAGISLIDPTCGSGHFLIGAFERLLKLWRKREPDIPAETHIERVLEQITGVDINQFAVAIARFRLVVTALKAAGRTNLNNSYDIRVATGDSLLRWGEARSSHQGDLLAELEGRSVYTYYSEDGDLLAEYLRPGTYTVVVGNPPYIPVKDRKLSDLYRDEYWACFGKWVLTVPFAQRFFELARRGDNDGRGAGVVGQITSNSFMKREFGRKLVNELFAHHIELKEIIDTSGCRIPGHGTATAILVGYNRLVSSRYSEPVRTVLGIRGEPPGLQDPAHGRVWTEICKRIDEPGRGYDWVGVFDMDRDRFSSHPWSLSGGGAETLMEKLTESAVSRLGSIADSIGIVCFTLEDSLYVQKPSILSRREISPEFTRPLIQGDDVRDWTVSAADFVAFPYNRELSAIDVEKYSSLHKFMWPAKAVIANNKMFGRKTKVAAGLKWSEFGRLTRSKLKTDLSICYGEVATHNHFALDRGGNLLNRTAPLIKLPREATEGEYLQLLGLLNSSVACFWLKQVSHAKAGSGIGRGIQPEAWMERYQFNSSKLKQFPVPKQQPSTIVTAIDNLVRRLADVSPKNTITSGVPERAALDIARSEYDAIRRSILALQEELDWQVYGLYGLLDESPVATNPPGLVSGQRAFEIIMARTDESGKANDNWFARHRSTKFAELPDDWPHQYRDIVERRIAIIESNPAIGLLERPEFKRRWTSDTWDAIERATLREWLLNRLEQESLWGGAPVPLSVAQLADRVRHDDDFRSVLDLWIGTDQHDLLKTILELIADAHVPFLATDRYKPSGLRKRALWERTWRQQRRADAGDLVTPAVPPKYAKADFSKASYWNNRGELDVPRERFISYVSMGRDGDDTLLLGWAGWDYLDQARALATVYLQRKKQEAWPAERLLPLLAGLLELEPWLHQWHHEPQPGFPGSPAKFFSDLIDNELTALRADRHTLIELRGVEELA